MLLCPKGKMLGDERMGFQTARGRTLQIEGMFENVSIQKGNQIA